MNQDPMLHRLRRYSPMLAIGTGLLALTACSNGSSGAHAEATPPPTVAQPSSASRIVNGRLLTFDDLGGGSSIIEIYPGVENTTADRQYNGTFNSGDTVLGECKVQGRMVHSNTAVGELKRASNEWIRVDGAPGEVQYATAVYVQNSEALLQQLPNC